MLQVSTNILQSENLNVWQLINYYTLCNSCSSSSYAYCVKWCIKDKFAMYFADRVQMVHFNMSGIMNHVALARHTAGTESIQTPLSFSLFVSLHPFAKIKTVHIISHEWCTLSLLSWQKKNRNVESFCKCIKKYHMILLLRPEAFSGQFAKNLRQAVKFDAVTLFLFILSNQGFKTRIVFCFLKNKKTKQKIKKWFSMGTCRMGLLICHTKKDKVRNFAAKIIDVGHRWDQWS